MTENFITIENVSETELCGILLQLANLYIENEYVKGIQLYRKKDNSESFLILFSNQPDFERFNYFVNYIKYPEGYENFSPLIRGYFKSADITLKSEFKVGEWIMVYISPIDREYDNVNLTNINNESYLYDFGGRIKKLEQTDELYKLPSVNINDYVHIKDIHPTKSVEIIESKPWWKFW